MVRLLDDLSETSFHDAATPQRTQHANRRLSSVTESPRIPAALECPRPGGQHQRRSDPAAAPSVRNVHLLDAREASLSKDRQLRHPAHPQLDQHVDALGG